MKLAATKLCWVLFSALFFFGLISAIFPYTTKAVSAGDWRPGKIIDDPVFFNKDSMSPAQIQEFLNSKVPVCDTNHQAFFWSGGIYNAPPYTCLKDYTEGGKSSAQIIWEAGQAHGINPQVLIVMLQKESALVTDTWAAPWQYKTAMGYGCPDTADCDSQYFGFTNQVNNAAWQLKAYINNPNGYNFKAGVTRNIQWNPNGVCGSSPVYIENSATAALYNYTPYQPNQAALNNLYGTGDGCSAYGNRNFWRLFNDWFGSITMSSVVRNPGGSVFVLSSGYKFYIPSMAVIHDYGIDPTSIPTISDSSINSIPWGNSINGQSGHLNYLIKTTSDLDGDGPTLYVVTVGKKYSVTSMDQFNNFNFNLADISYLPENYISSIPYGGNLSNFIQSPTNNAFYVSNGQKNIILDYQKYLSLNPSNNATFSSYFFVNRLQSGDPLVNGPTLIKFNNGAVNLFSSGVYFPISSMDIYNCWGFASGSAGSLYSLTNDSYVAISNQIPISTCAVQKQSGNSYLLNKENKFALPSTFGITPAVYNNTQLDSVIDNIPSNNSSLNIYVKDSGSPGIWKLENGKKLLIPTIKNFNLLKIDTSSLTLLSPSTLNSIPSGDPVLSNGIAVKTADDSAVYAISGNERIAYQSSEEFLAFGNKWSDIETYSNAFLQNYYPYNSKGMQRYIYNSGNSQIYLIDASGCYNMNDDMLTNFGKLKSTIISNQNYNDSVYNILDFSKCKNPSLYVKSNNSQTVYKVNNGTKKAFSSWLQLLIDNGGVTPVITVISEQIINPLTLVP